MPTGDSWPGSFGGSAFRQRLRQRGGDSLIDLWVTWSRQGRFEFSPLDGQ
jgi:hypothetical protein